MRVYRLQQYIKTDLPLAVWLETPYELYQEPHQHDCYEIVFICTGTGWTAINGERAPILMGDVYVLNSDDQHEFSGNAGLTFYNVMFSSEIFSPEEKEVFAPFLCGNRRYIVAPAYREQLSEMLSDLVSEFKEKNPGKMISLRTQFVQFMIGLLRYSLQKDTGGALGEKYKTVSKIFDLIARRYREKLTLEDLAAVIGCSAEYAGRLFKNQTGTTFTAYLSRYRIGVACRELKKGEKSISEIAADLGYFDTAYFDKCFLKVIGMPPLAYRKLFSRQPKK